MLKGKSIMSINTKTCVRCGILKEICEFRKDKNNKDGYIGRCKQCMKQYNKEYAENNKERLAKRRKVYNIENKERFQERNKKLRDKNKDRAKKYNKEYQEKNKEKIQERKREYNIKNKEKRRKYQKEYYLKNKEYIKELAKKYYQNNKENIKQYKKRYIKSNKDKINERARNYRNNNVNAKIAALVRTRIRETVKLNNSRKSNSSIKLLGCSIEFFREYLESKFTTGMTWENHGLYGWHIDHIIPCASFDLSDPAQQELCFHYTNMQPLWSTKEIAIIHGEDYNYLGNLEKGRLN